MELMASCFDKLLKLIRQPIPESILGKLTLSVIIRFFDDLRSSFNCFLDSHCLELFEGQTRNHASRCVKFDND